MWGGEKIFIFYLRGIKKFLSCYFIIDPPTHFYWVINDQTLSFHRFKPDELFLILFWFRASILSFTSDQTFMVLLSLFSKILGVGGVLDDTKRSKRKAFESIVNVGCSQESGINFAQLPWLNFSFHVDVSRKNLKGELLAQSKIWNKYCLQQL